MTATRRQAREWAIQMLTAADLNPTDDIETLISDFWSQHETLDAEDGGDGEKVRGKLKAFAEDRVRGVLQNLSVIDGKLQPLLQEWELTFKRLIHLPKLVVINEAIDLANWFSTPKSRTIVNGVLDRYAKQ